MVDESTAQVGLFARPQDMSVGVVTLGLIGGSLALALREQDVDVTVWDRNPVTRDAARAAGLQVVDTLADLGGCGVDLLIVASPLFAMADIMQQLAAVVPSKTTVTDAGSVKERVRAAVEAAGLGQQYVGAHPMAGTEKSGFGNASAQLFEGATWGVTLDESTDLVRVGLVIQFITELMRGKVLITDDKTHDDSVALVSHLPHVLSHALTATVAAAPQMDLALHLAAGSFRDGSRVARGSAERNAAMISDNPRAVRAALGRALLDLQTAYDALGVLAEGNAEESESAHKRLNEFFGAGEPVVAKGRSRESCIPDAPFTEVVVPDIKDWARWLIQSGLRGGLVERAWWRAKSEEVTGTDGSTSTALSPSVGSVSSAPDEAAGRELHLLVQY